MSCPHCSHCITLESLARLKQVTIVADAALDDKRAIAVFPATPEHPKPRVLDLTASPARVVDLGDEE